MPRSVARRGSFARRACACGRCVACRIRRCGAAAMYGIVCRTCCLGGVIGSSVHLSSFSAIMQNQLILIVGLLFVILVVIPTIVASFLRNVEAGTIRMVSWITGGTVIYRGPGKSKEVPL